MSNTKIPNSQVTSTKGLTTEESSRFIALRWVSSIITVLALIPLVYLSLDERHINRITSLWHEESHTPYHTVEYLDVNEQEYLRLGLTPRKPIKITPLPSISDHDVRPQIIHGRFLHITDIHPDENYKTGSSIHSVCHGGKPQGESDTASKYGDAMAGCDSSMALMEDTMEWIKVNLKDKIDFVIWTGDNMRHDSDRKYPRTEMKILQMNKLVAGLFHDVFHGDGDELDPKHFDVPVVPSLGNNDVYPHNLFSPGPTLQTRELWTIWQNFVPDEQMHVFQRGAYFFNEVIPGRLAVLSINTLYLFKSNPLTESCDRKRDPGYELFKWLGVTLEELRSRGMKVWLSGHVPPIPKNYDISCYRKFAVWVHEYRDIIIGGVYGHMNMDHFIPSDSQKAYKSLVEAYTTNGYTFDEQFFQMLELEEGELDHTLEEQFALMGNDILDLEVDANPGFSAYGAAPSNKEEYMDTVRETFYADVKGRKGSGENGERYAINMISASIIPTFNPGMRVWEYNTTGLEATLLESGERKPWTQFFEELESKLFDERDDENDEDGLFDLTGDDEVDAEKTRKKKNKKKKKKKSPKSDPTLPSKKPENIPVGPAYTPQLFSPTKFVQYYLDLKSVNSGKKDFGYEIEYKSDDAPLNMKGLLVNDYLKLARKLSDPIKAANTFKKGGKPKKDSKLDKLWSTYKDYAFVSSGYHD